MFQLSQQILDLFHACEQQSEDLEQKEFCRAQLQIDIQRLFPCMSASSLHSTVFNCTVKTDKLHFNDAVSHTGARIFLAGSSLNGFGSRTSDADLCLVVQEGPVSSFICE